MSKIGIITNPHSKLNKRNPKRKALLGYILGGQGQLEVTHTLHDLERVATEFHDKEIDVLAINGGDGTVSRTLTAFAKAYRDKPLPTLVLLRGGTINVLANNLGVKGSPEQILYRLTEAYSSGVDLGGKVMTVSSLSVEGTLGFLFANGAAPSFLDEYYKRKSGPVGAAWWVLQVWLSGLFRGKLFAKIMREKPTTISAQGIEIQHSSCAVFCSTLPKMPLGYPLFDGLGKKPHFIEKIQIVSFAFRAQQALWRLPIILLRWKSQSRDKISFCVEDCAEISGVESFSYTLDGELFTSKSASVRIRRGPQLRFLVI